MSTTSLAGDAGGQHDVEGAQPVGRDDEQAVARGRRRRAPCPAARAGSLEVRFEQRSRAVFANHRGWPPIGERPAPPRKDRRSEGGESTGRDDREATKKSGRYISPRALVVRGSSVDVAVRRESDEAASARRACRSPAANRCGSPRIRAGRRAPRRRRASASRSNRLPTGTSRRIPPRLARTEMRSVIAPRGARWTLPRSTSTSTAPSKPSRSTSSPEALNRPPLVEALGPDPAVHDAHLDRAADVLELHARRSWPRR